MSTALTIAKSAHLPYPGFITSFTIVLYWSTEYFPFAVKSARVCFAPAPKTGFEVSTFENVISFIFNSDIIYI